MTLERSPEKQKALQVALAQIEKQFGKGAIMKMDGTQTEKMEVISTGSLGLDMALGVGGLPKGRIIEIYGPESSGKTTLTLHAVANCQKEGGVCAFVDAEHALDIVYAQKLGVQVNELIVSQPDNGEQALEIVDSLINSGAVDLIVVDSVAALTPKAEIEGDMGDSHMGLQARLMSQALRKITGKAKQMNCTVVFINQIRSKIGVMFGCFHYDARVLLSNGKTEKIGKIVNNKMEVEVMCYNDSTQQIEAKPIQNWYVNGKAKKFYNMLVKKGRSSGISNVPIADDHLIPTPFGEKRFSDLSVGDTIYVRGLSYLSKDQLSVAVGSILGDGSLRTKNGINASLRIGHGAKQTEYAKWKQNIFNKEFISSVSVGKKNQYYFETKKTQELIKFKNHKKNKMISFINEEIIENINPLSLAIWYLDDGTFSGSYEKWGNGNSSISCKSLSETDKKIISEKLKDFDLSVSFDKKGMVFNSENTFKFHSLIQKYVPTCMEYKIHPKLRGCEKYIFDNTNSPVQSLDETTILEIKEKPSNRKTLKFDIEVLDNHNYFVDDILVHNSPETTTGGNALKYYATIRLDIRRTGSIKKGDDVVGNETTVKVVKNKVSPPFKKADFEISFGSGISKVGEIIDLAVTFNIVEKSGAWYSYKGAKIGQGRENVKEFLLQNPTTSDEIEALVREKVASA